MFFIIYKITNMLNDRIYIGAHKTSNLEDEYMGSGNKIRAAIKKHGLRNFKREILSFHDSELEMYAEEARLVTAEFIKETSNYNITPGGKIPPNWTGRKRGKKTPEHIARWKESRKDYTHSEETKMKIGEVWKGRKHSEESKQKMKKPKPPRSEEHSKNISIAKTGKKRPERSLKWRENIAASKKGKTWEEIYGVEGAKRRRDAYKA
jgi:hypothetical protein